MKAIGAFFTRFSKAVGALGGGTIGAVIGGALAWAGHPVPANYVWALPVLGGTIATTLAPPNSLKGT